MHSIPHLTEIDWSLTGQFQRVDIPGARRGFYGNTQTSFAAKIRRQAKQRGLTASVQVTDTTAAVRLNEAVA
jgi:hypothetical protein